MKNLKKYLKEKLKNNYDKFFYELKKNINDQEKFSLKLLLKIRRIRIIK